MIVKEKVLFYKVVKGIYMNKLILIFLLLGVLGFSKDKTVIRDKKISEEKRKFSSVFLKNVLT